MTGNVDVSTCRITAYTTDSWNPPLAYGLNAVSSSMDSPEEANVGQKRSRQYTTADPNAFWSASTFPTKTASPYVSGDFIQRAAFSEVFVNSRKHRVAVTSKSPPPVVGFLVADEDVCDEVNSVKVNIDATLCAASIDCKTVVWSLPSSSSEQSSSKSYNALFLPNNERFEIPSGRGISALDFCPDSPVILTGSSRGKMGLWSIEACRKIVSYTGHSSRTPVWDVAWSPAGGYFASGAGDGLARLWRSDVPYPIRLLSPENGIAHCHLVKWHPSCQVLAVASTREIVVFDISGPSILFRFDCQEATALEFSPTGYLLACANADSLCVYETNTGSTVSKFDTFSPIVCLSWTHPASPGLGDGGLKSVQGHVGIGHPVLLSVEESGRIRLWDKLYISKPSVCELSLVDGMRPLHMHVTPRNLLVVAGVRESSDMGSMAKMRGM